MHIKKLNKIQTIKILQHDRRANKNYRNSNIDPQKSDLNTLFSCRPLDDVLNGVYIYGKNGKNKDKINYSCSVIVHYPDNCPVDDGVFFQMINDALENKFGAENVILSAVHCDETRPHLHFVFCPIVQDPKHGRKLCAKNVVNREMLQHFHGDIEQYIYDKFNKKISLQNEESKRQIPYIDDVEQYKKIKSAIADETEKYNKLVDLYNSLIKKIKNIKKYLIWEKNQNIERGGR